MTVLPNPRKNQFTKREIIFTVLSIGVFLFVFVQHFYQVASNAVDFPFWDDWTFFPNDSPTWAFDFLNEHRTVPTKALIALLFQQNGWDIQFTIIANFVIFSLTVWVFIQFLKWACKNGPTWAHILVSTCLLSPILGEVHHWGIGSIWHFVIVFGILAVWLLFAGKSVLSQIAGVFCLLLSLYSSGQGLAFSAVVFAIWLISEAMILFENEKKIITKKTITSAGVGLVYLLGLVLWFEGFRRIPSHAEPANPWTIEFFNYFGVMIQYGFGFPQKLALKAPWIGILAYMALTVAPIAVLFWEQICNNLSISKKTWALMAMICGVSGIVFLTCYGRGNFEIGTARSGRYVYFVIFLIPLSVALWVEIIALKGHTFHQGILLIACILIPGLHFRHGLDFAGYEVNQKARLRNLSIIADYYKNDGPHPLFLPDFWVPLDEYLADAKARKFSFYRKIRYHETK